MSTQRIAKPLRKRAGRVEGLPPHFAAETLPDEAVELEHAWYLPLKAILDFLAALLLLILSAPVILAAAVLVKLTSRGPAFYLQKRLGKGGRPFTLYKLRSMVNDAERITGPIWADADDSRITPAGRFLRNAHIDELPQLVNVLLGHMSLIGPRPERPEFVPDLEEALPRYRDRLKIRPGMTGFAQLRLPPDSDLESVRRKLVYDLYYVRFASPWLDARLLFFTSIRLSVDALKAVWRLVALPRWAAVERHVPALIDPDVAWDASEDANGDAADCGESSAQDSPSHPSLTKAR